MNNTVKKYSQGEMLPLETKFCGACGAYGGGERCAQGSRGETRGKEAIGEGKEAIGETQT